MKYTLQSYCLNLFFLKVMMQKIALKQNLYTLCNSVISFDIKNIIFSKIIIFFLECTSKEIFCSL